MNTLLHRNDTDEAKKDGSMRNSQLLYIPEQCDPHFSFHVEPTIRAKLPLKRGGYDEIVEIIDLYSKKLQACLNEY